MGGVRYGTMARKSTATRTAAGTAPNIQPTRTDRRVQRTRRLLSRALVELIVEKGGYEKVTVQDILDRADVGRSTFYAHYENKDVLLVDGPRNMGLALFGEKAEGGAGRHHPMGFRALLDHVNESRALAKAMLGRGSGAIIIDAFRAQIADAIRQHYQKRLHAATRDRKLAFAYLTDAAAAAVMSLLTSWVEDDCSLSVDVLSDTCQQLLEGTLPER